MSSEEDPRWERPPSPDDDTISRLSWGEKVSGQEEEKLCKRTTSPAAFDRQKQAHLPAHPRWKRRTLSQTKRDVKSRNSWDNSGRSSRNRSRSKSRSPDRKRCRNPTHASKRKMEIYDTDKKESASLSQVCKYFTAGRCKRGSSCKFHHRQESAVETEKEMKTNLEDRDKGFARENDQSSKSLIRNFSVQSCSQLMVDEHKGDEDGGQLLSRVLPELVSPVPNQSNIANSIISGDDKNEAIGDPLENVDGDNKVEEGENKNHVKVTHIFKCALVAAVKNILNPMWTQGKINKETYKTIVKKAVDKVTDSLHETNIPKTKKNIDKYLSYSKPKLTKLVLAYVEKMSKGP